MTDNNVLLSPSEAAELLNVSPVTLRQWSQKGRIPFQITPGGHRRYKRSELYSFAKIMGMELSDPSAPAKTARTSRASAQKPSTCAYFSSASSSTGTSCRQPSAALGLQLRTCARARACCCSSRPPCGVSCSLPSIV